MKRATLLLLALVACDDLTPEGEPELDSSVPTGSLDTGVPDASSADSAVAEQKRQYDTTSDETWVYLDLETGEQRADEAGWTNWDLKLQRFNVATNGGASGAGTVKVAVLTSGSFDALTKAPIESYTSDPADGSDTDDKPDYVISTGELGWWNYDENTHALSPRPYLYVVRSQEGAFYKVAIESYYNAAGSSGYLTLRWAKIAAPDRPIVERTPAGDAGVDGMTSASKP
jgi:hypothetical protein